MLVSNLLSMYKEEYTSAGGDREDIQAYTAQNLTRKIKKNFFKEVTIKLAVYQEGNFIYSYSLPEEDA